MRPLDAVGDQARPPEPEQRLDPSSRVRSKLERAAEQPLPGIGGDAGERRLAGYEEQLARARADIRGRLAVLERPVEVICRDLGHLRLAPRCDVFEPRPHLAVEVAPLGSRQSPVRHVVRQRMLERELAHPRDRRLGMLGDESTRAERGDQRVVHADRPRPEDAAHHRAAPQRFARGRLQQIDASRDHAVDRVRQLDLVDMRAHRPPAVLPGDGVAVDQHLKNLLDIERVALGPGDDAAREVARQAADPHQRVDELQRLRVGQRREPDRRRIPDTPAPRPAGVEELRAGRADRQDGSVGEGVGQLLHQLEEGLGGPVDILHDEHGQPLAPEPAEVPPPALA